jgi:hypothetical protein
VAIRERSQSGPELDKRIKLERIADASASHSSGNANNGPSPEKIIGLSSEGVARLETIKAENREQDQRAIANLSENDVRAIDAQVTEYLENRRALRQLLTESPSLDAPSPPATEITPAPEAPAGKKPCRPSPPQPMTHQILELFSDVAKIEGVTIAYRGKDGAAAKRLAVLFQDKPEDLEDLCAFFFGIRKKRDDRFWSEQPPTPSAFLALLSRVQTLYAKERPRKEDAEVCPACGGPVKASASLCPHCGLSKGSFSDEAAIEAARRRTAPMQTAEVPA